MAIVQTTSEYLRGLDDIFAYIAVDSPTNAKRYIRRIRDTVKRIAQNPGMGRPADFFCPGCRLFPIDNYLFFYEPIDNGIHALLIVSAYRDNLQTDS